jgi:glycosyltransferase involved in cell wall biosynthesis
MPSRSCRILTLAPYRILPATTGGHWGIVSMHDALGKLCQDHVLSTVDNGPDENYAFQMHRIFPASPRRYVPTYGLRVASGIAQRYDATHIFCDHPYMAPLAIALSRKLHIPWALRSHNIEAERFAHLGKWWWRIFRLFEQYAMRAANAIFFITPEDCDRAIMTYDLPPDKCFLAPYGTTLTATPDGHEEAKDMWASKISLNASLPWLYFLGVHSYAPNAQAVGYILNEIYPRLLQEGLQCEILIGGKGLSSDLNERIAETKGAIRATGFIEDLDSFLKACDVMLNPLTAGGGIKTKAVEALAYNKIVVSTGNGAAGILPEVCGNNLLIRPDGDWDSFTAAIKQAVSLRPQIPDTFYEHYNWTAIAHHILNVLVQTKYSV